MKELWDVAVIGGGPAGMMAAGRAAERGAKVVLIEKNATLGRKLLITGGGRCNVTNAEFDTRALLSKFRGNDKFLFSVFAQWGVKETLDFFEKRGMKTKVEAQQRVFPVTDKAQSVWDVLVKGLEQGRVTILSKTAVKGLQGQDRNVVSILLPNKKEIHARSVIVATGGKSRPETGSTGEGFEWLKSLGHTVEDAHAALVPIAVKDGWVRRAAGVSLSEVKITLLQGGVKQGSARGKVLFTHVGLSGPTILNMSHDIGELLSYGEVVISLDLLPKLDYSALNTKLQEVFALHSNKKFKNALSELIQPALAPVIVELSGIPADKECHSVTREERLKLVKLLKHLNLDVKELLGLEKAVVTSGGVALNEVDFKTMRSRLFDNLYLVGDILNIDRPSGGYSLQLCWTTGFVAGNSVPLP